MSDPKHDLAVKWRDRILEVRGQRVETAYKIGVDIAEIQLQWATDRETCSEATRRADGLEGAIGRERKRVKALEAELEEQRARSIALRAELRIIAERTIRRIDNVLGGADPAATEKDGPHVVVGEEVPDELP